MTWQECKLVTKDVQFIVPEITCNDHQVLWYYEPEPKTDTRMTNTFKCEVKSSTNCQSQTRTDCKQITWNECRLGNLKKTIFALIFIYMKERLQSTTVVIRRFMFQHKSFFTGKNVFFQTLIRHQVRVAKIKVSFLIIL